MELILCITGRFWPRAAIIFLMMLTGCAGTDPWGQAETVPRESSRDFRPERDILAPARKVTEESVSAGKVGKEKMTLAECIVVALENNPQTRSSWQAARAASDRAGEKKAPYLPYLDFSTGVRRSDTADIDSGRERESGPTTTYDAAFGVRYLLYDGGRRAANLSEAQAQLYAANFRHNTALQDVALSVEEAYYQLIANMWSAEVAEETVAQTEHHVGVARARHESGVVSRSDVLKARTERANARLQLVRAKSAVKVSRGKLAGAMNLKVSEKVEVEDIPEENRDREIAAVEKLLQEAARGRPELQAALAEVQSRQAGLRAARSEYRPDLTANANYGWRDENFAPNEEEWSAGLGLSLPLFTGFERSYRTRRAESELQQAISDYENALRSVALDVWTAYAGVQEADEAIEAAQALVASAEESLEVARSEYKEGAGSITELIDAQMAYSQARNHLVQSRLDWHENLARLDRAVGRSVNKQALNLKRDK